MSDIAHELKVRPLATAHNGRLTVPGASYVLLSPQERDEAATKMERQRDALADARGALNLALLADGLNNEIKGRLRTAWLKVGDVLGCGVEQKADGGPNVKG